MNKKMRNQ